MCLVELSKATSSKRTDRLSSYSDAVCRSVSLSAKASISDVLRGSQTVEFKK